MLRDDRSARALSLRSCCARSERTCDRRARDNDAHLALRCTPTIDTSSRSNEMSARCVLQERLERGPLENIFCLDGPQTPESAPDGPSAASSVAGGAGAFFGDPSDAGGACVSTTALASVGLLGAPA